MKDALQHKVDYTLQRNSHRQLEFKVQYNVLHTTEYTIHRSIGHFLKLRHDLWHSKEQHTIKHMVRHILQTEIKQGPARFCVEHTIKHTQH